MDVSKFLAKVMGIYFIIVSVAMLVNMQQFKIYISNLINDPSQMFVAGFFTLILGILVVVAHNIWQWNWKVIITIVGWIGILKGTSLIFYPQFLDKLTILFLQNQNTAYIAASIDLIFGILLCYFGFKCVNPS